MPFKTKLNNEVENINEEYNQIVGGILKYIREEDGISLNYVSESIEINKGYLSQIEHGKTITSDKKIKEIFDFYEINFDFDKTKLNRIRNILYKSYNAYAIFDKDEEKQLLESIVNFNKEYNYGFFIIFIIELMYLIQYDSNQEKIENKINQIHNNLLMYNDTDKSIFFELLTIYYLRKGENEKAFESIKISNSYLKTSKLDSLKIMIKYHFIIIMQRLNYSAKALDYCLQCIEECKKQQNYNRLIYSNLYKANCYSRLGLYKEAEIQYFDILQKIKFMNNFYIEIDIYDNLSWNSIKSKNYEDAIKYTNIAFEKGSNFLDLYINKPYAYYMLKDYQQALKEIEFSLTKVNQENNESFYMFLNALKSLIKNDEEQFLVFLKKSYDTILLEKDYEMQIFLLNIKLKYYKEKKNNKEIIRIQDELLNIYQNK